MQVISSFLLTTSNPKIYESVAIYDKKINIYESFIDYARHTIAHVA